MILAVSRSVSSPAPGGLPRVGAGWPAAAPAPHTPNTRRHADAFGYARCRRAGARGLEVSLGGLGQDQLVQREVGYHLAQSAVLKFQLFQPLHLIGFQPTELLPPSIERHLTHADLADGIGHARPLRDQNIPLPQLRDDLLRLVSLPRHIGPP